MRDWPRVDWHTEQAEQAYVLAEPGEAMLRTAGDAALVGRIAERRLESRVGYLRVYAPMLRVLRLVDVVGDAAGIVRDVLHDVDVATTPALPVDSVEYRSLLPLNGDPFTPTWERRRLVLPENWDAFLASRTRKIRAGIRYDMKRLEESVEARVRIVHEWSEDLVGTLESIAEATYQRRLGAGFSGERADVLRVALEHGWARVYLLDDGVRPVAYWWCGVYRDTVRLNTTGYLPEYARHRPGI
jgi:GNAT acetyltransferase-like protein